MIFNERSGARHLPLCWAREQLRYHLLVWWSYQYDDNVDNENVSYNSDDDRKHENSDDEDDEDEDENDDGDDENDDDYDDDDDDDESNEVRVKLISKT